MNTEPNPPQQAAGELPSQYGREQQNFSTSPPTSYAAPQVPLQGQKHPRRLSLSVTVVLIALVVLLAGGSGLLYYTTVYQPNLQHTQATASALAQVRGTAQADATRAAQLEATGQASSVNATLTPTISLAPGIGVPTTGGNWQVTIKSASRTTTWRTYTAKSGHVFLVLDATFDNLSSSQKTIISTKDAMLISQDGKKFTPDAFEIMDSNIDNLYGTPIAAGSIVGFSCLCQAKVGVSGNSMTITLVFVLEDSISGMNLKFQFQQVPPIPFSAI